MAEAREQVTPTEVARWVAVGLAVLIGLGLYLLQGDGVEPVARPVVLEETS